MSRYLIYRDGGKHTEEAFSRFLSKFGVSEDGIVVDTDLAITQAGSPNMSVNIAAGDIFISKGAPVAGLPQYVYHGWSDATENVAITSNGSGNPRIDAIVAYVDTTVLSTSTNNNQGALTFAAVAGTPAGTPAAPTDSAIQSAIGASNPWVLLAHVAVAASASSIVNANITDKRPKASTMIRQQKDAHADYVASGLVASQTSGLVGQITAGYAYISGQVVNKPIIGSHTFTASKDTYVDLPNTAKPTATDDYTYTEVSNGANSPSLASGSIRIAKVVTNGSAITSVTTSGFDSNNIQIRNTSPSLLYASGSASGLLDTNGKQESIERRWKEVQVNFIQSVNTGTIVPSSASLNSYVNALVAYVNGKRISLPFTTKTFTASKDTYVDLKDDGTLVYVEVANGASSGMTLTTNSDGSNALRLVKVVTSGSAVTSVTSYGNDPLGNLMANTDRTGSLLGLMRITSLTQTFTGSPTDVTGATITFNAPGDRTIEVEYGALYNADSEQGTGQFQLFEGASNLFSEYVDHGRGGVSKGVHAIVQLLGVSSGVHTYKLVFQPDFGGANWYISANSAVPLYIKVKAL